MKTQRPRANIVRRPEPDAQTEANGSKDPNGRQDTSTTDSAQAAGARTLPPSLPKRRSSQQAPSSTPAAVEQVPAQRTATAAPPATPSARQVLTTGAQTAKKAWHAVVTYENAFWFAIFVLAIVTRFWEIHDRALHHDESLHAVYSRNLYNGTGYQHDPMMHGPLQFHFIGAMYWLFGTSDGTARFASALCSIFVVMSPFFLKRQMGRLTALICGFLLLVSPSILYFGRMAREDSIFSGMEMIMIVGLWRFVSTRKPADFYIFCAGLSLMFTIKETAYLSVAVLGALFVLLFALQAGYAILGALTGYLAIAGGFALWANSQMKSGAMPQLPDIPETNPNWETITRFAGSFLTHPLVVGAAIITLLFIVAVAVLFRMKRREFRPMRTHRSASTLSGRKSKAVAVANGPDGSVTVPLASTGNGAANGSPTPASGDGAAAVTNGVETGTNGAAAGAEDEEMEEIPPAWDSRALRPKRGTLLAHYEAGSMPHLVGGLFARPSVLLIGFTIAAAIFIVLYSTFFTDVPRGIASGLFASLGYWMAQHDVQRGGQPWFYYLLLIPLYEPIAFFFALFSSIFFSWRGVRWLVNRVRETRYYDEPRLALYNIDRPVPFASFNAFLPLFIGWWLLGAFFIYSWAGEKMPWLMVHMVRPAIFMASLFIGSLIASMIVRRRKRLARAGLLDDPDQAYSGPLQPRRRAAAGAMFSLDGVRGWAANLGLVPLRPSYEAGAGTTVRFSASRGSRSTGVPSRSKGAVRTYTYAPEYRTQDPPWVSWNRPDSLVPFVSFLVIFMLLAFGWGLGMSQVRYGAINNHPGVTWSSWGYTWFFPAMMLVMLVSYSIWLGVGRAMRYFAVGMLSVMLVYQIRSGTIVTYQQPDVSTELASYVQSSPDVTRVVRQLEAFSRLTTGGKDVRVVYDSEVSWPFEWYLGDYPNKQFIGGGAPTPAEDVPVMFVGYQHLNNEAMLQEYVAQRYALRWWFPEEWYKNEFLPNQFQKDANGAVINDPVTQKPLEAGPLGQIGDMFHTIWVSFTEPQLTAQLWNYLMYREPPKPLGSTDFVLFVRKDVAQLWNNLEYKPLPSTDLP